MEFKMRFSRFMAKVLICAMLFQGMPLMQLSRAYVFEFKPQRYHHTLETIVSICSMLFSPRDANAGVAPDPGRYTINTIPGHFVDISGNGTRLTLTDEGGLSGIPIGFDFSFFGVSSATISVTANGYLSFGTFISPENTFIPSPATPNSLIAPFWDDLNPDLNPEGGIYFETVDTEPNRKIVVEWKDIPLKSDPDSRLTFEVILFESSNEIQFQYLTMRNGNGQTATGPASGNSATIGIENSDGTEGNLAAYNLNGTLKDGTGISFTLAGNAYQKGNMLGDLDGDDEVTILDQSLLTHCISGEHQPLSSLQLLLSDVAPIAGTPEKPFGDSVIDGQDHSLIFDVIMERSTLSPTFSDTSYIAATGGETLTLSGSAFDSDMVGNNMVIFIDINGQETAVQADTVNVQGTELTVAVPDNLAFISEIRIEVNGTASNSLTFTMENQPMITGISPSRAREGDTIYIKGYEFGDTPGENNISFNGVEGTITALYSEGSSDILEVTVPAGATSGPVTVTTDGNTSNAFNFSVLGSQQAEISFPDTDTEITAPTRIFGTALSDNMDFYVLEYAPAGTDNFTEFARGTTNVEEGMLGTLDPTLLENGIYTVRLTVNDQMGESRSVSLSYFVKGDFKVGFFSISFKDLEIPLAGIPIQVIRTYDSRRKGKEDDFGYGWTLSVKSYPRIQKNHPEGEGWAQNYYPGHGYPYYSLEGLESHAVSVTLENGRTLEFDFTPQPSYQAIYPINYTTAAYTARPGTAATLEPLGDTDLAVCSGELCTYDMSLYDPQNFKLTLEDGTVYTIGITEGLSSVADSNGNEITFTDAGIFHSSGESIGFIRDAEGRITTITDPAGNDITYSYDGNGDLESITDRNNNTTTFTYLGTHYLDEIRDPSGNPVSKSEYDASGRLVAMIDAEGNRIDYTHNIDARQEVVEDRLGYITIYEYDNEGRVVSRIDHLGHRWAYTYNTMGKKTSETDPLDNTTLFTYDDKGHLLTTTDPLGRTTTYTYDNRGKILTETDHLNHVTTNTYDGNGNLVQIIDPEGGKKTYTYNDLGLTTSETVSPDGSIQYTTTYEYDTHGHLVKEIDPSGHETRFEYDDLGRKTKVTKTRSTEGTPLSVISEFTYDGENRILTETDANGAVKTYEYDSSGNKTALIDPLGRRTEYTYDDRGNLILTTCPDGKTEASSFDFEGRIVLRTDRDGNTTQYEYDFADHPVKTTFPDGAYTESTYDEAGRLIKTTTSNGSETEYEYDGAGQLVKITDALDNKVTYEYDGAGRRTKMIDSLGRETQYEYDAMGRLTRTVFADGTTRQTTYDLMGRKTGETDQAGKITQYEYDALGQIVSVIDALGHETTYAYDEIGNKINQTDANGHVTHWSYDNMGRELSRTLPLGMSEYFAYDLAGNLTEKTDFSGNVTEYTYDLLNHLILKKYSDNSTVAYTYTFTGKRASVTDENGTISYLYDNRNRLIQVTNPDGSSLHYTYDAVGNRLSTSVYTETTLTSTHLFEYDALNRLTGVTDTDGRLTSYAYDNAGNRSTMTYPNGVEAQYTYDDLNRLVMLENVSPDDSIISSYTYTLGASGNRLQVLEDNGRIVDYSYDDLYRLTEEAISNDPAGVNETISYTYDAVGNRLTKTDGAGTISYTYDANDRLTDEFGPGVDRTYTYDDNGNRTGENDSGASKTYTFDYENRMVDMQSDTSLSTYAYDADGLRIEEDVDGVFKRFIFDKNGRHAKVMEERESDDTVIVRYTWGNTLDPIFMERDGTVSHYLADGNLNVRILVDTDADISDTYDLDAFGKVLHSTGNTENSYLLHGQYYDANSGFYYLRARWMDPRSGTFLSLDPAVGSPFEPQSLHKYVFAANNPLTRYDPSGLFSLVELNMAVGIVQILSMISLPIFFGMMTGVFIKYILGPGFEMRNLAVLVLISLPRDKALNLHANITIENDPIAQAIKLLELGNDIIRIGSLSIKLADSFTKAFGAFQNLAGALKNVALGNWGTGAAGGSGALGDLIGVLDDLYTVGSEIRPIAVRLNKAITGKNLNPKLKKTKVAQWASAFNQVWQKYPALLRVAADSFASLP